MAIDKKDDKQAQNIGKNPVPVVNEITDVAPITFLGRIPKIPSDVSAPEEHATQQPSKTTK